VHWCDAHLPSREGSDDAVVTAAIVVSGSAEAGGDGNRRWCDLFHREMRQATSASTRRARRTATAPSVAMTSHSESATAPEHDAAP
jgi:hypothetical protein